MPGPRPVILPVFLPQAGCPGRCLYCSQQSATGIPPADAPLQGGQKQASSGYNKSFPGLSGESIRNPTYVDSNDKSIHHLSFPDSTGEFINSLSFADLIGESIRRIISDYRSARGDTVRTVSENEAHTGQSRSVELAFYGGNFTGLPVEVQEKLLGIANHFIDDGTLTGIRISIRPDHCAPETVSRLKGRGVSTVEIGVQTMVPELLARLNRGHTVADSIGAVKRLKEAGITVGVHLMVGLPAERPDDVRKSAETVAGMGPDHVRIHPLLVLEESPLAERWRAGAFRPLSLPQAVRRTAAMVEIFQKHAIPVARMALHPPDGGWGNRLLAGPWHPAFSELVHSFLFRRRMWAAVIRHYKVGSSEVSSQSSGRSKPKKNGGVLNPLKPVSIAPPAMVPGKIRVHPRDLSRAIGYRRENAVILKRLLGQEPVFETDPDQPQRTVSIL